MDKRIRFVEHGGKRILLIDFSHCSATEILTLLDQVQEKVSKNPQHSVLTLGDFTDAHFDKSVVTRLKEVLVRDRPYVKRTAWVGTKSLPHVFYENAKSFSQRELPAFETREEAMDWLIKE